MSAPVLPTPIRSKKSLNRAMAVHAAVVVASVLAASIVLVACGADIERIA